VTYLRAFGRVTELRKLGQNQRGGYLKSKKWLFDKEIHERKHSFAERDGRPVGRPVGRRFFLGQPLGIPGTPKRGVPHHELYSISTRLFLLKRATL